MPDVPADPVALRSGRRDQWIDIAWLIVLGVWCVTWCETAAARVGVTYDEPFYMLAGLTNWRTGHNETTATNGVMPLPVLVATIPLYLDEKRAGEKFTPEETIKALPRLLPQARRLTLGWLALLILTTMRLGQAAGGPWAGRLAAGLIAADPNFLAHSSLATTDISVTATLMAMTMMAYLGQSSGWLQRIVVPGVCFGLAVLCKLSALLYGGVILVVLEVGHRLATGELTRPAGATSREWVLRIAKTVTRSVLKVAAVIGIGIGIAMLVCGYSEPGTKPMAIVARAIPKTEPLWEKYQQYGEQYDEMSYAIVAFLFQTWHNSEGRPAFLNGTYYPKGCWFHFPVLMAMKVPLPALLLAFATLFRLRRAINPFLVAALILVLVTLTAKLQIGVRLVLPVIALGYVGVAVGVVRSFGRCGTYAGIAAMVVMAATSVWVWPHGLGYLNQLAGGPSAAPERVCDSNLDWGQGIPDLLEWHKAHGEPEIALWYFGTDPAAWKPPFVQIAPERAPIANGDDFRKFVGPRLLAVGATVISLHPEATPAKREALQYLRTLKPVARTATFTVYDLREPAPPHE